MNHLRCRATISAVFGIDVLIESIGSGKLFHYIHVTQNFIMPPGIVLYRLYVLWRFERLWTYTLFGTFALIKLLVFIFAYVSIAKIQGES